MPSAGPNALIYKFIDKLGQRFGRLLVVAGPMRSKSGRLTWKCKCDCGKTKKIETRRLVPAEEIEAGRRVSVGTESCGCLHSERASRAARRTHSTHGLSSGPEYRAWSAMRQRCNNPRLPQYRLYGGSGISVCSEWESNFVAFYGHIGPRPSPGHSVDRIDPYGNYEPGNVRWATAKVQANNRRART